MSPKPKIEALRLTWEWLAQKPPAGRALAHMQSFATRRTAAITAAALAIVALAVGLLAGPGGRSPDAFYLAQQALLGDLDIRVSATGTVEPIRIIDVSTELSGTVKAVHSDYNDVVKAGDLLAELDGASLVTQLQRARSTQALVEARLREGRINLTQVESDLERKRRLMDRRAASERDVEVATAAAGRAAATIEMLTAELAVAAADVDLSEANLAKARIVSPIDGVVLRRSVEPGQAIAASLQAPVLFRIAPDLGQMQVRVDVDEADALAVQPGQAAAFKGQALRHRDIPAIVRKIYLGPEIVQGVVTYKAILGFDNQALQLKPGMTATADISVARRQNVLLVPNAAFRFAPPAAVSPSLRPGLVGQLIGATAATDGVAAPSSVAPAQQSKASADRRRLYKLSGGKPVATDVRIGLTDGSLTEIQDGDLTAGETVILDVRDVPR